MTAFRIDVFAERVVVPPLGNVRALAVVGEWRAATHSAPRRRAVIAH